MLIAARNVREFAANLTEETFRQSKLHQSAIVRELQIIGEAARLVSQKTKTRHPAINWTAIAGMRNRMIHEYFRVDLDVIWETVENDIGDLTEQLTPLVPPDSA
jgi:uncharacterized protein with HEPN domain